MGMSIRNAETVAKIRKLAALKGVGLTEAIDAAVDREIARLSENAPDRTHPIYAATEKAQKALGFFGKTTEPLPKSFFDELYED
jgi:hypothetical protein